MSEPGHSGGPGEPDGPTVPWAELHDAAYRRLVGTGLDTARQEARWLVEEAAGFEGTEHLTRLGDAATIGGVVRFDSMLARRLAGEPIQYVLGHWAFRELDLVVDRRVLIPRPETESVVEVALQELDRFAASAGTEPLLAVDLGTGSGAIALSLAAERVGLQVIGTELSADALNLARANLAGLGGWAATRLRLLGGDWFDALPDEVAGAISVIVANPPYVAAGEVLPPSVRDWEPMAALLAGPTGLEAIEVIIAGAQRWLAPSGVLVVEIGETQAPSVVERARSAGFGEVEVRTDLAGRDRTLVART